MVPYMVTLRGLLVVSIGPLLSLGVAEAGAAAGAAVPEEEAVTLTLGGSVTSVGLEAAACVTTGEEGADAGAWCARISSVASDAPRCAAGGGAKAPCSERKVGEFQKEAPLWNLGNIALASVAVAMRMISFAVRLGTLLALPAKCTSVNNTRSMRGLTN